MRAGRFEITHLQDYIVVVDCGSLSRAATRLHISQPAVGQRINQLEAALGVPLLVRGPRGVAPTPYGRALYREAHQLVAQFERLTTDVVSEASRVSGSVSVGLPSIAAHHLAARLVAYVHDHFPAISLRLFESPGAYLQELLSLGRLDLAVLYHSDLATTSDSVLLHCERLSLVGPPPEQAEASSEQVMVEQLRDTPLVLPARHSNLRSVVEDAFAARGLRPRVIAEIDSVAAMVQTAEAGVASTILPSAAVSMGRDPDFLPVRRINDPTMRRVAAVHGAAGVDRDAVVEVRRALLAVVADLVGTPSWPDTYPVRAEPPVPCRTETTAPAARLTGRGS